jgi:hypothetical protein
MNISFRFLVTLTLLLIAAEDLPAPISEIATPTPTVAPKHKSKQENVERTKPKQSPFAPFVGVWSGPTTGSLTTDIGLNVPATTSATTFRISNDGMIQGNQANPNQGTTRASVSPDGRVLTWTYQYNDSNGSGQGTASLRLIAPKTASYQVNIIFFAGGGKGTMKGSGTLTKQ